MTISGFAYLSNEQEEYKKRQERYEKIKHLKTIKVLKKWSEYQQVITEGTYEGDWSSLDIALYCDGGCHVPFGGYVEKDNGNFTCVIYTA